MYKNRQCKWVLAILVMLMGGLSFKLVLVKEKFISAKKQGVINITKEKKVNKVEKYGYSDILKCLTQNKDFGVKSINMIDNEKCDVEVDYKGDIKLLYSSLSYLNENKNFLSINKININRDDKITNISINFKKNK